MRTLSEIGQDIAALEALLFELGGDVTDEDAAAAIDGWLAENREALSDKLDGYGALIRERELKAQARKAEADRLYALAQTDENLAKRLKERLRWFFETEGIDRLETDRFKFSLANNGGKAPVVVKCDPWMLPDEYRRVTYSADVEAIRAAIEAGAPIQFAEIGERGKHIRLR